MTAQKLGLLFILIGPTGAGKNTLMNGVLKRINDLAQLPTATTRPIRSTEKEGREHTFVTTEQFQQMLKDNELLEWQNVHGNLYGVPRHIVASAINASADRIADVDILGALNVRAAFPDNVILIFVQPGTSSSILDTAETIRVRLEARGEPEAEIENRLKRVEMELSYAPVCDYLILNDDKEQAIQQLQSIIMAERSRRDLLNLRYERGYPRHRLTYRTISLILRDGKVLRYAGELPTERVLSDEYPHEAALRSLNSIDHVLNSAFHMPVHITTHTHDNFEELTYWHIYHLKTDLTLPDDWTWDKIESLETMDVPEKLRNELKANSY